jgi:hypothetical protein
MVIERPCGIISSSNDATKKIEKFIDTKTRHTDFDAVMIFIAGV